MLLESEWFLLYPCFDSFLEMNLQILFTLFQIRKDLSPGKHKISRENAKTYVEKYMPDMQPVILEALRPYEEEVSLNTKHFLKFYINRLVYEIKRYVVDLKASN